MKLEFQSLYRDSGVNLRKSFAATSEAAHAASKASCALFSLFMCHERERGEKQSGHLLSLTCDRALIGKAAKFLVKELRALAKTQRKASRVVLSIQ